MCIPSTKSLKGLSVPDRYPCNQASAENVELYGHSAHVTGVALIEDGRTLVSAGGREGSIIQRTRRS